MHRKAIEDGMLLTYAISWLPEQIICNTYSLF